MLTLQFMEKGSLAKEGVEDDPDDVICASDSSDLRKRMQAANHVYSRRPFIVECEFGSRTRGW